MKMDDNQLLMPFIGENDDPKYVTGFEAGMMWRMMENGQEFDNYLFHASNQDQIELMCRRFLYSYRIDTIDETWCSLFASIGIQSN